MAQLIVRNLESEVKARLKRLASRHGRSMEEEARDILRNALKDEVPSSGGLGTEFANLFRGSGLTGPIQEIRGQFLRPVKFDE